jgi:hypothetical protein
MLHDRSGGTILPLVTVTAKGAQAMSQGILCALAFLVPALLAHGAGALAHEQTVTVVSLNVFHGIACVPVRGEQCRLAERIDLLFEHLAAIGCPDIVTLQEVLDRTSVETFTPDGNLVTLEHLTSVLGLMTAKRKPFAAVCGFEYTFLYAADPAIAPDPRPLFSGHRRGAHPEPVPYRRARPPSPAQCALHT